MKFSVYHSKKNINRYVFIEVHNLNKNRTVDLTFFDEGEKIEFCSEFLDNSDEYDYIFNKINRFLEELSE